MASRPYKPGKYFNGEPCPKGHIAERLIYNKQCVVCKREGDRKSNIKATRKYQLSTKYNLSEDQVNQLRFKQNHQCAICRDDLNNVKSEIDHCHKTGEVRGILCNHCNRLLGAAKDSVSILSNAMLYLKRNNND